MGFTGDFIIRRIADLRGEYRIGRIIALGLDTGDGLWQRVEQTFMLVNHYLATVGIKGELVRLRLSPRLVREARDWISYAAGMAGDDGIVEVYTAGGSRVLVTALIIAAFMADDRIIDRIRVVSYGEGFPGSITVWIKHVRRLSSLDDSSLRILNAIRDGNHNVNVLKELLDIPRSTLYKKLDELEKLGFVKNVGRGKWVIQEGLEHLI